MRLSVRIDARRTTAEFKEARRQINRHVREGLGRAATREVLPKVQRIAPNILRGFLTAKATGTRAYLTTQGPKRFDRIAGLLNYGGTRRDVIKPKNKNALSFDGIAVAQVTTPRKYKPKGFIERGMESSLRGFENVMLEEVMEGFSGLPNS